MKLAYQLIILFIFISLIPVVLLSSAFYFIAEEAIRSEVFNQLESVASMQKVRVIQFVERNKERLSFLSDNAELARSIDDFSKTRKSSDIETTQRILTSAQALVKNFKELSVADVTGRVIASTNVLMIGKSKIAEEAFVKGSQQNTLLLLKDQNRQLVLSLSRPVRLGEQTVGVVMVLSDADEFLATVTDYTGLGKTGEVYMGEKDQNGDALYITPLRFDPDALLRNKVSRFQTKHAIIQALSKVEKVFPNAVDYRSKEVLAATRYIENMDWGLVVKIDRDEAFAPLEKSKGAVVFVVLFTIILVTVIAVYFTRSITKVFHEIVGVAKDISQGDFSKRVMVQGSYEVVELGSAFNRMAEKLQDHYVHLEARVQEKNETLSKQIENIHEIKGSVEEEKLKLEAVLNSLPVGVVLVKAPSGEPVLINKRGVEILGQKINGQEGFNAQSYQVVKKDGSAYPLGELPINITLQSGEGVSRSGIYIRRQNGALTVALRISSAPIKDANNSMRYAVAIFEDMTKEEEIDKMKTEFISLASHQLRTPLSAIRWFAEMMVKQNAGALNPRQARYAENIYVSTKRMISLVNALLNISRIESGRIVIDPKPTHLGELLKSIAVELQSAINQKHQNIALEIPESLPAVNVDPQLIREVYANLVSNAVKYTPEGGTITVSIANWGSELVSKIKDSGYGIPKNQQSRVFQKFYRGDNIVTIETEGTGLGLYLVKAIIESSGGKVWFESEEGKGTTFWFSLPLSGSVAKEGEAGVLS